MSVHLPTRLLACAGLALSAGVGAMAVPGDIAGAAVKTVSCSPSGPTSFTNDTLSSCTGTDTSQTGGTGVSTAKPGVQPTLRVVWKTGKTSTISNVDANNVTNNCPSRSGLTKTNKTTFTGKVTGGTATELVKGSWQATICSYQTSPSTGSKLRYYFDGKWIF
jgi:hypothetical protein